MNNLTELECYREDNLLNGLDYKMAFKNLKKKKLK